MDECQMQFVDQCVAQFGKGPEKVLQILQAIQGHYGYLPEEALQRVCSISDITPASIWGVSTFYDQFRHRPAGKHIIRVCVGTACHVKGSDQVYDAFRRNLGLAEGEDTDCEKLFTIEKVACLGCCTLAPAAQIGDVTYGHLTAEAVEKVLKDFLEYEQNRSALPKSAGGKKTGDGDFEGEVRIGLGSCCVARGSAMVNEALLSAVEQAGINVRIKRVGCVGMCHQTPLLEIVRDGKTHLYAKVQPHDAGEIILRHFRPDSTGRKFKTAVVEALDRIICDRVGESIGRYSIDVRDKPVADFLGRQKHIASEYCGQIDPVDIDEYIEKEGFAALEKTVKQCSAEQVIRQVEISGLRGRGGAGYPTYLKWQAVAWEQSEIKYAVCNGDEGDPGAFMDRMLMESYPYRIIEGMAIAAYAVGAKLGRFYIRAEYPLAVRRIRQAIETCRARSLLGPNIMGSGFSFDIEITEGAGAFVCGEETALMASIEGRRGMPRLRPPWPAQSGLWTKPTLINNVETYALVPWIIRNGGQAFAALGTSASKGTKVFALAGKIARGGLIEVPMGITLSQIVYEIGGGIGGGKAFKAVQVGGPSGGCVPAELADITVDYESLTNAGAIMGSGGLVVLDETDCMVDIARYFLEFTQNQSCGKCTFCRIGTRRMLDILSRLCLGQGKKGDIEQLEQLGRMVKKASLCGLGKTAPNPVLSTIKYFRDEYQAHLEGRCPAGKCRSLIRYVITDDCIGCTLCAQHCPADAIEFKPYEKHRIDASKCIRCGSCKNICPADSVSIE